MTNTEIETILAIELFKKEIYFNIGFLSDENNLKNLLKYNEKVINDKLSKEFFEYREILQKTVDSNYLGYYEVNSFEPILMNNFKYSIQRNLETLNAMKKLIKFVE